MEDSDMSSSANLDAGNSAVTPGITVTSPEDGTVQSRELKSARMVFRRMDRKSIFTIVQMSKDPRIKSAIVQRGEVVANRWRKAALRAKIQSSTVPSSGSAQDRPKSKVTVNDIARLAVAERDSNIPSDTESDNDVPVEKFAF
ncbi:uncharacterized protein LOC127847914 [Dreissena polymorpha]|nr:uncharacterized protein LOC127847914 [Dreissena polymorpha]